MPIFSAFLWGVIFATGLGLAGMTRPGKILAFLDVGGNWDPSLMLVMGGAVGLTFVSFPRILRRGRPVLGDRFDLPVRKHIDGRLVGGAAIFGVGWGLTGYCPGPAVVSLVTADAGVGVFLACLLGGIVVGRRVGARQTIQPGAVESGAIEAARLPGPSDGT
ncbi:DUF6691 family protein [Methylococcus capsulatus]|jgi:uncharacterized membrane protein YedE/YeeE|uniref:YeeE/YedE family protein n=1 Tax=Methylococcus capsulatus TaxID=414 RepID=A0AA35Y0H0_METCP|nr:DUF6691 family protein [Methylococcus capsulatus]CAI8796119.1 conserved membrane protein of unknown function [Methylococcus capsulatus]